jgi:hypothetical protein
MSIYDVIPELNHSDIGIILRPYLLLVITWTHNTSRSSHAFFLLEHKKTIVRLSDEMYSLKSVLHCIGIYNIGSFSILDFQGIT